MNFLRRHRPSKTTITVFSDEINDFVKQLHWEIADLQNALQARDDLLNSLREETVKLHRLLDKYAAKELTNDKRTRNQTVVKLAKKNLKNVRFCAYCGRKGTHIDPDGNNWHMDHIIPIAMGGADELWNITKACRTCNLSKGANMRYPREGSPIANGTVYNNGRP